MTDNEEAENLAKASGMNVVQIGDFEQAKTILKEIQNSISAKKSVTSPGSGVELKEVKRKP